MPAFKPAPSARSAPLRVAVILVTVATLAATFAVSAQSSGPATRLTDFFAGVVERRAPNDGRFGVLAIGEKGYFIGRNGDTQSALWSTDGSAQGTQIIANPVSESIYGLSNVRRFGNNVIFGANDSTRSMVWLSDGTTAGTRLLSGDQSVSIGESTVVGNQFFFVNSNGSLWATDGTSKGTRIVNDINGPFTADNIHNLGSLNGKLFYSATDDAYGSELWASDGTTAGTRMVKDITPGSESTFTGSDDDIAFGNEQLFFRKFSTTCSCWEVWKSDGTDAGTVPFAQGGVAGLVTYQGNAYFFGNLTLPKQGSGLWRTDGTSQGTQLVAEAGVDIPAFSDTNPLRTWPPQVGGSLLFFLDTQGDMWRTDGTKAGLVRINTTKPIVRSDIFIDGKSGTSFVTGTSGFSFFLAASATGTALWRTDGSAAGTVVVRDFPGVSWDGKWLLSAIGSRVLISVDNNQIGGAWVSNGTSEGTTLLFDLSRLPPRGIDNDTVPAPLSASQRAMFTVKLLPVGNAFAKYQLWASDGTSAGTKQVSIPDAPEGNASYQTFSVGEKVVLWDRSDAGVRLMRLDSFDSPAVEVKQFPNADTWRSAVLDQTLLFLSVDNNGNALWKSDGTTAGTVLLKRIYNTNLNVPAPSSLQVVGNRVFFRAYDAANGYELWTSDGTAPGTKLVADLDPGPYDSWLSDFTNVQGTLYFVLDNKNTRIFELWKSDGSTVGTTKVVDLPAYRDMLYNWRREPIQFTAAGGTLFFFANPNDQGYNLWKSDGTAAGTVEVRTLTPQTPDQKPRVLAGLNNTLLFSAYDSTHGRELWRSDGTANGTYLVKDINVGIVGANPNAAKALSNGRVVFAASDGVSGTELWVTDGSAAGTWRVQDIAPGPFASAPRAFVEVNNQLFFYANTDETGRELWAMPIAALATPPAATPTPTAPSQRSYIPMIEAMSRTTGPSPQPSPSGRGNIRLPLPLGEG